MNTISQSLSPHEQPARRSGRRIRLGLLAAVASLLPASLALGARDEASAASSNLFAVVDQMGNLISGNHVAGVTYLGVGRYEVTFDQSVEGCAYVATTENAYSQALAVYTAGGHLSSEGVYVETKNQGGGLTDGPFHLIVSCGSTGQMFAVVGYDANLVRSSAGATLTPLGSGRYEVSFPSRVGACSLLATVGDPGHKLVFNPSGVYTGSGPNANTVYIETKNPGGGLQDGVPFHLAVICPSAPSAHVIVVRASGLPTRGSALTSSFNSALGQYTAVMSAPISECATVATRGSVDKNVPFSPATVELVPGPAINTIGIQLRNLLFFGGSFIDESFHAATLCK